MKFLKGLALSLLGFLLFLSLSVLGLALMLNNTILNPDFVVAELDKLDVSSLAKDMISAQIPLEQIPQEGEFIAETLDDTIADLEPWIKEQVSTVTYSSYDYLLGKSQSLSVIITLEPVKETLRENLREALFQSLPPELQGLPQAEIERYFDEFYRPISEQIPSTFEIDESLLPSDVLTTLEQVRQGIGYFQTGYPALIGFIVLLILGIILINRQVKGSTRSIGSIFLSYGVIEYAGIWATKYFATPQFSQLEIPSSLQAWIPQLLGDFLAPLEMFSLGLLIGGVVLLTVSFVYRRG